MSESSRILLVYPYDNIATNPTMLAILDEGVRLGIDIDILCVRDRTSRYPDSASRPTEWIWRPQAFFGDVTNASRWTRVKKLLRQRGGYDPIVWPGNLGGTYVGIVGVDPQGLVTGHQLSRRFRVPLHYLSFELLIKDEIQNDNERALFEAEGRAIRECRSLLIQDHERLEVLRKSHGAVDCKIIFGPVAPTLVSNATDLGFRSKLQLTENQKILLFQGSIAHWSGRDEWRGIMSALDRDHSLVVNSRSAADQRVLKYLNTVCGSERLSVLNTPLKASELVGLTAAADIGLATYHPNPENWTTLGNLEKVGLASGKFAYYMMCGVPVLTNTLTNLATIVEKHGLGRAYADIREIKGMAKEIIEGRTEFSDRCRQFYRDVLDPKIWISDYFGLLADG